MQAACPKCDHLYPEGVETPAPICPACGAVYAKVMLARESPPKSGVHGPKLLTFSAGKKAAMIVLFAVGLIYFIPHAQNQPFVPSAPTSSVGAGGIARPPVDAAAAHESHLDECFGKGEGASTIYFSNLKMVTDIDFMPTDFMTQICERVATGEQQCEYQCQQGFKVRTKELFRR